MILMYVKNKVMTKMTVKTAKIPECNDGVQARQFSLVKSGTFSKVLVLHRSPAGYLDDDNDCDDVIMMMMGRA